MDYSISSLLNITPYHFQHGTKSVDELSQRWLCTNMELESLKIQAQDEILRRDEQLCHVKDLLYKAMVERDEALKKCKSLLQQQVNNILTSSSSSVCDDDHSNVSSSPIHNKTNNNVTQTSLKLQSLHEEVMMQRLVQVQHTSTTKLPEKGKFLEAVMNAGPLLETILVAGHLPQWRHPPPLLESIEIPLVTINRSISRKRSHYSDSSIDHHHHKLQKQHNNINSNTNSIVHQ